MDREKMTEAKNRAKEKYYSSTRFRSKHHRFSVKEDELILGKRMTDREIADLLEVSIVIRTTRTRPAVARRPCPTLVSVCIVNVRKNRTLGAVWTDRLVLCDLGRYAQPMSQKL